MRLISLNGLNCYTKCVITIANELKIDYMLSFANIWAEEDFIYDSRFKLFYTRQMIENLKDLGMNITKKFCGTQKQAISTMDLIDEGEFIIIGMDAYNIPWSPIYQLSHEGHYFITRKANDKKIFCYDPSYNANGEKLLLNDIFSYAYEINPVQKWDKKKLKINDIDEAKKVLNNLPVIKKRILNDMDGNADLILLARYVDAMGNNRYLYSQYLKSVKRDFHVNEFFNEGYFLEWKAAKNGLVKSSYLLNNEKILNQVKNVFNDLINKDVDFAKKILKINNN